MVRNVVIPTVTMFKPAAGTANGTAFTVAPISSARLYEAWHKAGESVELHIFSNGGHGFGMLKQNLLSDPWIELFKNWMASHGYINDS